MKGEQKGIIFWSFPFCFQAGVGAGWGIAEGKKLYFLRKWSESWGSRNLVLQSHGGFMDPPTT